MHVIDDVFRPLSPADHPTRKEPISVKKLRQGDAAWSTQKEVLGWLLDTQAMTLRLTTRRYTRLSQLLHDVVPRSRKRISIPDYHKLLGELRSMSIALPGARGLFSILQEQLRHALPDGRIRLTPMVHGVLDDFRLLHRDLAYRPTRLQELVPLQPTVRAGPPPTHGPRLPRRRRAWCWWRSPSNCHGCSPSDPPTHLSHCTPAPPEPLSCTHRVAHDLSR